LITDFGTADVYAGVMKGVIAARTPSARVIDLTHEIPAGDVAAAAFRLWQAGPHMPAGTVYLAAVDPGVGTNRRCIAVRGSRFSCVGPDNGIFTFLLARESRTDAVEISLSPASATFHGRDVFAPAAALLAAGASLRSLGPAARGLVRLPFPLLAAGPQGVRGEVLLSDGFGNLITSIGVLSAGDAFLALEPWLPGTAGTRLAGRAFGVELPDGQVIPLGRTYADAEPGRPLAYVGSDGLLEIGVNRGSARGLLGLAPGAEVTLRAA
jgi:S-adenosyl-L-methionine hydrolase (adenosine-forming)